MKLVWHEDDEGNWKAEGHSYSYEITSVAEHYDIKYQVDQLRQSGGQFTNRTWVVCLDGAFAAAQVWENRENLRR